MPELPEVETIVRQLRPLLVGRTVTRVRLGWAGVVQRPSPARFRAELARVRISGRELWLIKPQDFMNNSGRVTAAVASFYKVAPEAILVAHDELDLPPGELRLKCGGGAGGHNGLKDLIAHLGEASRFRFVLSFEADQAPLDAVGSRGRDIGAGIEAAYGALIRLFALLACSGELLFEVLPHLFETCLEGLTFGHPIADAVFDAGDSLSRRCDGIAHGRRVANEDTVVAQYGIAEPSRQSGGSEDRQQEPPSPVRGSNRVEFGL